MPSETVGMIYALGASLMWATAPVLLKLGSMEVPNPFVANAIRVIAASLIYAPMLWFIGPSIHPYVFMILAASAIVGPGLGDVLFTSSIKRIGAGTSTVIAYQYILISQILSVVILGDYKGAIAICFTPLALAGIYLVVSDDEKINMKNTQLLMPFGSAFLWAASVILIDYALESDLSPLVISGIRIMILIPFLLLIGSKDLNKITKKGTSILALSGIISYVFGMILFISAISTGGVIVSVLPTAITPVITQFLSHRVVKEPINIRKIIGTLLVMLAILMTALAI